MVSCAGPSEPETVNGETLTNQEVTIMKWTRAKHSQVQFVYHLPLPNGGLMPLYGRNKDSGYYYKSYNLKPGQRIRANVFLYKEDGGIRVGDIDFSSYVIPSNQRP